jgi:hypothetical protein
MHLHSCISLQRSSAATGCFSAASATCWECRLFCQLKSGRLVVVVLKTLDGFLPTQLTDLMPPHPSAVLSAKANWCQYYVYLLWKNSVGVARRRTTAQRGQKIQRFVAVALYASRVYIYSYHSFLHTYRKRTRFPLLVWKLHTSLRHENQRTKLHSWRI